MSHRKHVARPIILEPRTAHNPVLDEPQKPVASAHPLLFVVLLGMVLFVAVLSCYASAMR